MITDMDIESNNIQLNLAEIKENIANAAKKSGVVDIQKIMLVAVTKTFDAQTAKKAVDLGVMDLGENKVQEFLDKNGEVNCAFWHMIGHLQTNKVKYIVNKNFAEKIKLIQSLESVKLAAEIDRRAKDAGITANCLIEINIAGENSKYGVPPEEAMLFAKSLEMFENIRVKGLMCVAPFTVNPENNRGLFAEMRGLFGKMRETEKCKMEYLSMGMSGDYAVAIEEGANMVRIGTALFGGR